ncbi:hypothetical protein [Salinibacterium sp. M195]|uniref:hypothetical protein n=1 Tax=Salinibacterium sp. M195 TaxID=2583374 RepID=UPI001C627F8D|nr:hypothetical protein [Salinibacterium sp. M195]QYH35711.1 hypothetical protein FFT87_06935 [Salinibacterium sp. M195]
MNDMIPAPLTGETSTIHRFAQTYRDTAAALRDAVAGLSELENENVSISLAVDEVRVKAAEASKATSKVATRYDGAADVYFTYQNELSQAQSKAEHARLAIDENNGNAHYWRLRQVQLRARAMITPSQELLDDITETNERVQSFASEYAVSIASYNQAVQEKADAVAKAIAGLDEVAQTAGLNDGFFEAIAGVLQVVYELAQTYLAPLLTKLRELLKVIKDIVDLLSFIVSILAIFIPALGPFALALILTSLALSATIFLLSLALYTLGKASLGTVLADGVSLVVSIVTSKLGPAIKAAGHAARTAPGATATVRTVFDAIVDKSMDASEGAVLGLAQSGADLTIRNTLDITIDQFPNENGLPAGTDPGVVKLDHATWDFTGLTDPTTASDWAVEKAFGIAAPVPTSVMGIGEGAGALGFSLESIPAVLEGAADTFDLASRLVKVAVS